ncbi:LacI family DNA-binding transcriptional regulator [Chthonobacter rhizosphaerae]|uniref:LacI family DNA-binding transcriptional regulator n=1 Tax=Chthonobacter rhizosphaerae TaxID=2735553 RepID=UPI0015EF7D18|nr:LacI family DNA-binding transcriptional regulator [Chthonobacter rhizosphaerae]
MKVTLKDVADAAGVSIATVDRVLNRREGVRGDTVARVEAAIRQLGYAPSSLASRVQPAPSRTLFLLPLGGNPFFTSLTDGVGQLREWLPFAGSTFDVRTVDVFDGPVLAAALERAGGDGYDGIAVVALDHPAVKEAINALTRAGVRVVTLVSDVPGSLRDRYVGIDNTAAGRTAGSLTARFLPNRRGKVAFITGSFALRDHAERCFGFEQVIAQDFPDVEVIAVREGRDDPERVAHLVRDLLHDHPDLAGLYNVGAGTGGVIRALEAAGRAREVVFVAHELTQESRSALLRGTIDAVIGQDPRHEARSAARVLQALINGFPVLDDQERIRIEVYLRDNLP